MNHTQKMAFVANQTAQALNHVARTPNIATPDGKMSHDKMLSFVSQITKHGLQHFDSGGGVNSNALQSGTIGTVGNSTPLTQNNNTPTNPFMSTSPQTFAAGIQSAQDRPIDTAMNVANPMSAVNSLGQTVGGAVQGMAASLTAQNEFQAQGAPVQAGTNAEQLNTAYQGAQNGLTQQQGLTNALTPGVNQGAAAQSGLSSQLANQAMGVGPNPAQQQFKQNSQALAGQQAGAIASTKGISPALQARMIAQQGGNAQQNAAGQAATLQAQQQIAAQSNLQNLSANQIAQGSAAVQGVNNAQQNEQNILQGANNAYNTANVTQQSSLNSINAGVAGQNAAAVNQTTGGLLGGLSSMTSMFAKGGMVGDQDLFQKNTDALYRARSKNIGGENDMNVYSPNYQPKEMAVNPGNSVEYRNPINYAGGGIVGAGTSSPQSYVGQWLNSNASPGPAPSIAQAPTQPLAAPMQLGSKGKDKKPTASSDKGNTGAAAGGAMGADVGSSIGAEPEMMFADGGDVEGESTSSPQDYAGQWLSSNTSSSSPSVTQAPTQPIAAPPNMSGGSKGGGGGGGLSSIMGLVALAADGGSVGANNKKQRAPVKGNSLKNDKIPALLSEDEIVIPRSITMSDRAPEKAAAFVAHILAKRGMKK